MKIAIASGKGGTGKTTVACNLAYVASQTGQPISYIDCDVEEPNGHLFLKPEIYLSRPFKVTVPEVDMSRCSLCRRCAEICQFNAIVCIGSKTITFPELCHNCGGCRHVCPERAITENSRETGIIEKGNAGEIRFVHGKLRIGEAMSPPLIREVCCQMSDDTINLIDAPPGTSCPVITAVRDSDFVLLVTEPTPFGLSDLELALEMIRELGIPHGVVVNRHEEGNESARDFCFESDVPMLAEIPDDRRVAEAYSRGELIAETVSGYDTRYLELWGRLMKEAGGTP